MSKAGQALSRLLQVGVAPPGIKLSSIVVTTRDNDSGQCDVADWTGVIQVMVGLWHTVGLKSEDTVVPVGL